jgi:hypothetical protein
LTAWLAGGWLEGWVEGWRRLLCTAQWRSGCTRRCHSHSCPTAPLTRSPVLMQCPKNCAVCTSNAKCTTCLEGFNLNTEDMKCVAPVPAPAPAPEAETEAAA